VYRSVFLSHSSADKPFARRLADDLREGGITVWFDASDIAAGDSVAGGIAAALGESDCAIVVLSPEAVASAWVQKELQIAVTRDVQGQSMIVIPLLYRECAIPILLLDKKYADFRDENRYRQSLAELLDVLGAVRPADTGYRVQSLLASVELLLAQMGDRPDPRDVRRAAALVARARVLSEQDEMFRLLESGQPVVRLGEVDLQHVLHELAAAFRPFAAAREVSIAITGHDRRVQLRTDRRLLELILHQLLDNAVKYSYAGTTISVEARPDRTIRVTNRGVQFPRDERPRIFEPAFAAKRVPETGVGLFFANQAAQALGGRISIYPSDDQTEVIVRL
jgi:signal transduction histidine kinase